MPFSRSENNLQSHLHVARLAKSEPRSRTRILRLRQLSERRTAERRRRIRPVRVIHQIENLAPQLRVDSLLDRNILEHREIDRIESRTIKRVAPQVAEGTRGRFRE